MNDVNLLSTIDKLAAEVVVLRQQVLGNNPAAAGAFGGKPPVPCPPAELPMQWQPPKGEWYVNSLGTVGRDGSDGSGQVRQFGCRFRTADEAHKARDAFGQYHRLYQIALLLNEGWEPDWKDTNQRKYCVYKFKGNWNVDSFAYSDYPGVVYFKDKATAEKALKLIEDENALGGF